MLNKEEARACLRLSASAFQQLLKRPDPPPTLRIGKRVLVPEGGLEQWLANRVATHKPPPAEPPEAA